MGTQKPYTGRFVVTMVFYAALLAGSLWVLDTWPLPTLARTAISVLPVVPATYAFFVIFQSIRVLDEFQQRIQLEATAFSLAGTGFLTFTYGFLENAGMPPLGVIWVLPISVMLWGVGRWIAGRRYR
jgi:hypothetical protein